MRRENADYNGSYSGFVILNKFEFLNFHRLRPGQIFLSETKKL